MKFRLLKFRQTQKPPSLDPLIERIACLLHADPEVRDLFDELAMVEEQRLFGRVMGGAQ